MKFVAMAALFVGVGIFSADFAERAFGRAQFDAFQAAICFLVIACAIPLIWPESTKK